MFILSVDFGTSSVKMALLNEKNKVVKEVKEEYSYVVMNKDWVTLDPELVFGGFLKGIKRFEDDLKDIAIIAYDVFSPSSVFMDKDGEALYPIITHLDRRSKEQTKEILYKMGKQKFQSITGVQPFTGGVSITNVLWVKENLPKVFNNTYKFGHLNTYIYHKLTGCYATDPTNASMMGLYETAKLGTWSKEICSIFDIPQGILPDIHYAGTVLGSLKKEVSNLTGLKEGIPVVLGSNDAATAQIGAGNEKSGDTLIISGSSEMVSVITDNPVIDDRFYLRNAITPGKWQFYATTVGGFAVDWFRKEFYSEMDKNEFFENYLPNLIKNYSYDKGVKFLPYLAGDRQSLRKKRGVFSGITLDTKREDFLTAILYGINSPIKRAIDLAEKHIEVNKTIRLTGGLAKEDYIVLKRKIFKGYKFEIKNNCPILGNGKMAIDALNR